MLGWSTVWFFQIFLKIGFQWRAMCNAVVNNSKSKL